MSPDLRSPPELVQGFWLEGTCLVAQFEGLEDLRDAGADELRSRGLSEGDRVVGIAAGGTTPFVHGALDYALTGALAIAMACVPADQAAMPCTIDIRLLTGPELLTGSMRLGRERPQRWPST